MGDRIDTQIDAQIDTLVPPGEGVVSRAIFSDEEIFQREMRQIFSRTWLFVGHESLIPKPDDYFTSRMGMDSVIVTRDRQGEIHVFHNSCTHRGMKLCRNDQGNARAFACPYHGWSFSTDGKLASRPGDLVGVPGFDTYYKGELDKSQWGLKRVAKLYNYKGTLWATWDPQAPEFLDYLGDMHRYLDAALDCRDGRPGGSVLLGGVQKWRIKCNWKFAPENFIGDLYHDISHRSVDIVGIGPSGGRGRRDPSLERKTICFPELGHGLIGRLPYYEEGEYQPVYQQNPDIERYNRQVYEKRVATLGDSMRVSHSVGTIFPNMSFHGRQPRTLAVFHPISATEMEMWRMYLVDADAPEEVKDAERHYFMRYSGPGGMTESDDMENWTEASASCIGDQGRQMFFNYQMGLGHAQAVPGLQGAVENGEFTEENARAYYTRWAQFMKGTAWGDLMPAKPAAAPAQARPAMEGKAS